MYKLSLNNESYIVSCSFVSDRLRSQDFIVDTGAQVSCMNAHDLDPYLCESDMYGCDTTDIHGIADGRMIPYYKYRLQSLSFAGLNLGPRDIWVTFDPDATDRLLGMDILSDCNFIKCASDRAMYFFA